MQTRQSDDWALFTSAVLLISSTAAIARDEIDTMVIDGTNRDHDTTQLARARSGVAALAAIAEHYEGER